jgi:hypothetical protein
LSKQLRVTSDVQARLLKEAVMRLRDNLYTSKTPAAVVHRFGLRQMIEALLNAPDMKTDAVTLVVAVSPVIYQHIVGPKEKLRMLQHLETILGKTAALAEGSSDYRRELQTQ